MKESIRDLAYRTARLCATSAESGLRDKLKASRNVDIALSAALRDTDSLIHDPVAYVDFLRGCIEPVYYYVVEVKADMASADKTSERFNILVEHLRSGLPAVEFSVAKELALIADNSGAQLATNLPADRLLDLGIFFSRSSSFGRKGRILFNLVRFLRSENCLELGTACGMSALFTLAALTAYTKSGRLTTLEGDENLFAFSSSLLQERYRERVACHCGWVQKMLPALAESIGSIDFMFHDCGHSREAYVRDFGNVIKVLTPGAVVLFDDIRWEDNWSSSKNSLHTYEGWQEVIAHPRVRRAVEIDSELGLLLIGS